MVSTLLAGQADLGAGGAETATALPGMGSRGLGRKDQPAGSWVSRPHPFLQNHTCSQVRLGGVIRNTPGQAWYLVHRRVQLHLPPLASPSPGCPWYTVDSELCVPRPSEPSPLGSEVEQTSCKSIPFREIRERGCRLVIKNSPAGMGGAQGFASPCSSERPHSPADTPRPAPSPDPAAGLSGEWETQQTGPCKKL